VDTLKPSAAQAPNEQEQPVPINTKNYIISPAITAPKVIATPKEKTETTEEYLFWVILGSISAILFAFLMVFKRKKVIAQIKKKKRSIKHLATPKAR